MDIIEFFQTDMGYVFILIVAMILLLIGYVAGYLRGYVVGSQEARDAEQSVQRMKTALKSMFEP